MRRTVEVQSMFEAVGRDLINAAVAEHDEPWFRINEVMGKLWEEWVARLNSERELASEVKVPERVGW